MSKSVISTTPSDVDENATVCFSNPCGEIATQTISKKETRVSQKTTCVAPEQDSAGYYYAEPEPEEDDFCTFFSVFLFILGVLACVYVYKNKHKSTPDVPSNGGNSFREIPTSNNPESHGCGNFSGLGCSHRSGLRTLLEVYVAAATCCTMRWVCCGRNYFSKKYNQNSLGEQVKNGFFGFFNGVFGANGVPVELGRGPNGEMRDEYLKNSPVFAFWRQLCCWPCEMGPVVNVEKGQVVKKNKCISELFPLDFIVGNETNCCPLDCIRDTFGCLLLNFLNPMLWFTGPCCCME